MEERQEWIDAIRKAIKVCERKKKSFKGRLQRANAWRRSTEHRPISNAQLGEQCPRWMKYRETSKCMICDNEFSALRRPKHHCRACAKVKPAKFPFLNLFFMHFINTAIFFFLHSLYFDHNRSSAQNAVNINFVSNIRPAMNFKKFVTCVTRSCAKGLW